MLNILNNLLAPENERRNIRIVKTPITYSKELLEIKWLRIKREIINELIMYKCLFSQ
jgi:hypothetical protein